ncbi:MAG: radical SAM protein [Lachnospiraceae bacterium]|nr:radical SAM protein [Lachnospiraceae bacterium]
MNIVLYGCGSYGSQMLKKIKCYSDVNLVGVADSMKKGLFDGRPIINDRKELLGLVDEKSAIVVFAMANVGAAYKMALNLCNKNTRVALFLNRTNTRGCDFLQDECFEIKELSENTLPSIEMHVVDYCNLNCRGCTHFSPLFEKENPNYDERMCAVKKIKDIFDDVLFFYILGGEPFLNPDICKYIIDIRNQFPQSEIQIITNGLLLTTIEEAVLKAIESNNITICISEYKPTHECIDRIINRIEEYDINYTIRGYDVKSSFNLPLSLKENSKYPYRCMSDGCISLSDGKIARCPTLMYVSQYNKKFNISLPTDGILNLDDYSKGEGKRMIEDLGKKVPLCKHCVENPIEWQRCNDSISMYDFAIDE